MLAIKAGVPILPLAHNSGLYWPAHQLQKTPGTIDVVIGEPIDTAGKSPKQLTLEIQHWINEMKDQLSQSQETPQATEEPTQLK